ncbi:MAG: hypothetical protein R3C97_01425 [Geminicoccaceae bacterium]
MRIIVRHLKDLAKSLRWHRSGTDPNVDAPNLAEVVAEIGLNRLVVASPLRLSVNMSSECVSSPTARPLAATCCHDKVLDAGSGTQRSQGRKPFATRRRDPSQCGHHRETGIAGAGFGYFDEVREAGQQTHGSFE